jgi:putative intracellular protease/amidase
VTAKRVLVVASNCGVWNEELQAPWDILSAAGHQLTMATPQGRTPLPLAVSMDPSFVDPIQDYRVNTPHACDRMTALLDSGVWDSPKALADVSMQDFDAIVMVGGLGADLDLANNPELHRLILEGVRLGDRLIAAICFSVGALVFTRDPDNEFHSIIWGRHVTAHPRAWDFRSGTTYDLFRAPPDNKGTDLVSPGFLLPLQDIAVDAVGPSGSVLSDPTTSREKPAVVVDLPFITGCSVESSIAYGEAVAAALARM